MAKNKLQDKVAVITGGAGAIGAATALLFAEHGARAIVIADVQDEMGQKLVESIGTGLATFNHCDVTDENQVKSLIDSTIRLYGGLDVMFCNAGTMNDSKQRILDFDVELYKKLFEVNVSGMTTSVKHAAKAMVERGTKGSIICTASTAATVGHVAYTDYVMSKWAVLGLMKSASMQLGTHGIRVNCVSPGPLATPLLCKAFNMGVEDLENHTKDRNNLGGVLRTKHVADAVLFLACDDSAFITGHNLVVDGGFK